MTVTATDTLVLRGTTPDGIHPSGISVETQGEEPGAGDAGTVMVAGRTVQLTDGALISSSTFGPGRGGRS